MSIRGATLCLLACVACTGPQGPEGPPGPPGESKGVDSSKGGDGSDGSQGTDGTDGLDGERGPAGETGPTGEQGPQGEQGPAGPPGEQGPQGEPGATGPKGDSGDSSAAAPTCQWCRDGETTLRYDVPTLTYITYQCGNADADGCGEWEQVDACESGETIIYRGVEDEHGLPSRLPGEYVPVCQGVMEPDDECTVSADCGPTQQCVYKDGARRCQARSTWMTGTGQWDYMADHFEWPVHDTTSASVYCVWGRSSYWHEQAAECRASVRADFDAPDGGLASVYMSITIDAAAAGGPIASALRLLTDATASARAGSVSESIDEVVITELDLRPGGYAAGTWHVGGTVNSNNLVDASGAFRVAFPSM